MWGWGGWLGGGEGGKAPPVQRIKYSARRKKIQHHLHINGPLSYGSQLMEDGRTLSSYSIKRQRDPSNICCMQMMKTGPRPAGATPHSPTHRVTGGGCQPPRTPFWTLDPGPTSPGGRMEMAPLPRDLCRAPLPGAPPKAAPGEF